MAPSIELLPSFTNVSYDHRSLRVSKKRKITSQTDEHPRPTSETSPRTQDCQDETLSVCVPSHPLGIKPSGNAYDARLNLKDACGSFAQLPEELLVTILECLEARDLLELGATCKALYAYCASEELWKTLFVESPPSKFAWQGTWRSTLLSNPSTNVAPIYCGDLYSDVLYLPYHRAHVPLLQYTRNIPGRNQIARLPDLTSEDFNTDWASKPFILTQPVQTWRIFKEWSTSSLLSCYGDTVFRAEAVDWPFKTYVDYMHQNTAESPLYLFDCRFVEKMGLTVGDASSSTPDNHHEPDYTPPSCFSPDLFTALDSHRPDHRWLIVGPERSGSTFHADPNGTSAWNAVIRGRKYWIMFPPPSQQDLGTAPEMPGLHISPDGSHITAPLSIAEYLLSFHAAARNFPGCIEAVCREGEVLHVPSGWYHMVLNLEDGIAVTQNFVPRAHLPAVLTFLRDRREQVSGFAKVVSADTSLHDDSCTVEGCEYELFVERLRVQYPEELEVALAELDRQAARKLRKSKWEQVTGKVGDTSEQIDEGFSFAFGFDGEDDSTESADEDVE